MSIFWGITHENAVLRLKAMGFGRPLIPEVDLDVVGSRAAFPSFQPIHQAEQEGGPLGTAMVHEFHGLLPVGVREQDKGLNPFGFQLKSQVRAHPFFGPSYAFPLHEFVRL